MGIRDWYDRSCDPQSLFSFGTMSIGSLPMPSPWRGLSIRLGVRTSYYFRALPCSFVPEVIESIHSLGHEVGYHYEDWSLARFDKEKAIRLFSDNLGRLRKLVPSRRLPCMAVRSRGGSNLTIWKHCDYRDWGVIDAIESIDYRGFAFFTDAGRTFGTTGANLRDYLRNEDRIGGVNSSDDLVNFLKDRRYARVHIGIHPERWNDALPSWLCVSGLSTVPRME